MSDHEIYLQRCIELALAGQGAVSPNPLVGSVVVHNEHIIGEGWHQQYGGPHAEVNAINSVKDTSLLKQATLYVSLEPCAHWGKTPPCADRIIQEGIPRVVIGCRDPFEQVNGKGIERLKEAGIEVITDVLHKECRELNKRFFTFHEQKRPYVILKWAQTADGFIAREDYSSKWISHAWSRALVHHWRGQEDAIMVGSNTAHYDNPQLTTREVAGKNPVRILVDRQDKMSSSAALLDGSSRTLILGRKEMLSGLNEYISLANEAGPKDILDILFAKNIQSVIIEGGGTLLNAFIQAGLWDEMRIFTAAHSFGKGIKAPDPAGHLQDQYNIGADSLSIFRQG